jgi:coenzyme A diphosphatase NUDT7
MMGHRNLPPFQSLLKHLSQYRSPNIHSRTNAAVLVLLFANKQRRTNVLLTTRSTQLQIHPGEVAFPGGKHQVGETDIQTALREAHEEIGLEPHHVSIVATLEPFRSRRPEEELIRPVVGVLHTPFRPRVNTGEVSDVFSVPLDHFLDTTWCYEKGHEAQLQRFTYKGHTIWGVTARILQHVAKIAYQAEAPLYVEKSP